MTKEQAQGFIDKLLSKAISRKLTVFIVACFALMAGVLDGDNFTFIAVAYIGTQGVIDLFLKSKK